MDKLASLLHTSPAIAWMVAKLVIVFGGVFSLAALWTWVERRGSAMIQDRIGPNRAALFGKIRILGLAQPLADGIKFFFKEDLVPHDANKALFWLAPFLALVPALMGFAVIPFGRSFTSGGQEYHLALLDPGNGMGLLYPLAIGGMAVYGVLVAAWSSNNKWSILGGMRASAAMVSYEIGMSLAVVTIFMTAGGYDPSEVISAQGHLPWAWNVVRQPLGFIVFFTCMFAETNRLPFDFAEGESEIVAGFNTEYGSMKFSLLALAEYLPPDDGFGPHGHPLLRGLAGALRAEPRGDALGAELPGEDAVLRLGLRLDPLDPAALPLRPAHASRLEGDAAALHGQPDLPRLAHEPGTLRSSQWVSSSRRSS